MKYIRDADITGDGRSQPSVCHRDNLDMRRNTRREQTHGRGRAGQGALRQREQRNEEEHPDRFRESHDAPCHKVLDRYSGAIVVLLYVPNQD
jgi:hypothetical protein